MQRSATAQDHLRAFQAYIRLCIYQVDGWEAAVDIRQVVLSMVDKRCLPCGCCDDPDGRSVPILYTPVKDWARGHSHPGITCDKGGSRWSST
jgi:hypothetical protein